MPLVGRERGLQVDLGALDVLAVGEAPAFGQAMDVRVDRERRHAEGLHHEDRRGLVADTRQRLERFEGRGHFTAVTLHEQPRHLLQVLRLGRCEADFPNKCLYFRHIDGRHRGRGRGLREERRRHLVDLLVGRLRR